MFKILFFHLFPKLIMVYKIPCNLIKHSILRSITFSPLSFFIPSNINKFNRNALLRLFSMHNRRKKISSESIQTPQKSESDFQHHHHCLLDLYDVMMPLNISESDFFHVQLPFNGTYTHSFYPMFFKSSEIILITEKETKF